MDIFGQLVTFSNKIVNFFAKIVDFKKLKGAASTSEAPLGYWPERYKTFMVYWILYKFGEQFQFLLDFY